MWRRIVASCVCVGALGAVPVARADECLVNGTPVPPSTLAFGLEAGAGASLPGQLAGVPFSVVSYENLAISWAGCGADCLSSAYPGESRCGDLVADPIDSVHSREVAGIGGPNAFSDVFARQATDGAWKVGAQAFIHPFWEESGESASFAFALGTREFIDVSSGSAAETLPLAIQLRAISPLGILPVCQGSVFRWIPSRSLRFRVTESSDAPPFTRDLVPTTYFDQFFHVDETFPLEVRPNSTLTVDVWFHASANATPANDIFGNQCSGALAILDFLPPLDADGIRLAFTPDAALALTPRSGIAYPVPEPAGAGAALVTLAVLGARRRCARGDARRQ